MIIIDSNNEEKVDDFLMSQVKHIYASEYALENQKQIKKQFEIIANELADKIISCNDLSVFNNLMKNGITKGYLNYKISNNSSKGYIQIKKKILDEKIDIPLRFEKIRAIVTGKDEKGEELWNNGNVLRVHRKYYEIFCQKNNPEFWEEICKINFEHKYREKMNRQGHSNIKKSYWAFGYDTLQDFYKLSEENDIKEYKNLHVNCCGLGDPEKSLKNIRKIERKLKRKEFRKDKPKSKKTGRKGKFCRGKNRVKIYRRRRIIYRRTMNINIYETPVEYKELKENDYYIKIKNKKRWNNKPKRYKFPKTKIRKPNYKRYEIE